MNRLARVSSIVVSVLVPDLARRRRQIVAASATAVRVVPGRPLA